jgi:S-methylmethionine-dependent homocysteine/selenocysteine methylase
VLFETIPSALEIEAPIAMFSAPDETLRAAAPLPLVFNLSLACRDAVHLNDGTKVSAALSSLLKARAALAKQGFSLVAVSINCMPPQFTSDLLRAASAAMDAQTASEVWDAAKRRWQPKQLQSKRWRNSLRNGLQSGRNAARASSAAAAAPRHANHSAHCGCRWEACSC